MKNALFKIIAALIIAFLTPFVITSVVITATFITLFVMMRAIYYVLFELP